MDQSQEILIGHAIFAQSEYSMTSYRRIACSINNKTPRGLQNEKKNMSASRWRSVRCCNL